jgi:5-methylcytosine-specific restriction endonuclease McrA
MLQDMKKSKPPYNQNAVIRGALRRAFARSPYVLEKMQESRREVPRYNKDGTRAKKNWVQRQCEVCQNWVGSTKITIDHISPVVSVDNGFQDWNVYIDRLWCNTLGKANLQRICDECHDKKTAKERFERMYTREENQLLRLSSKGTKLEDRRAFLKKFTKKRLDKFPYPQTFKDLINAMRTACGMKV